MPQTNQAPSRPFWSQALFVSALILILGLIAAVLILLTESILPLVFAGIIAVTLVVTVMTITRRHLPAIITVSTRYGISFADRWEEKEWQQSVWRSAVFTFVLLVLLALIVWGGLNLLTISGSRIVDFALVGGVAVAIVLAVTVAVQFLRYSAGAQPRLEASLMTWLVLSVSLISLGLWLYYGKHFGSHLGPIPIQYVPSRGIWGILAALVISALVAPVLLQTFSARAWRNSAVTAAAFFWVTVITFVFKWWAILILTVALLVFLLAILLIAVLTSAEDLGRTLVKALMLLLSTLATPFLVLIWPIQKLAEWFKGFQLLDRLEAWFRRKVCEMRARIEYGQDRISIFAAILQGELTTQEQRDEKTVDVKDAYKRAMKQCAEQR